MTTTDEFDFTLIERAGLTQQDFAELLGVARPTVNRWVNGQTPHMMVRKRVAALLKLLESKIDAGKLPVELPNLKDEARSTRRAALVQALK